MELQALQAFLAVIETGSFSRAAETLHLSQPAISKRVAALEQQLNTQLFDRIGRRATLTEAGRALQPHARQVLQDVEDGRRALSKLSEQISGKLLVATSHHIGLHRLPPILRHYTLSYPEVDLDLRFMDSEVACESVINGSVELAIVTLPIQPVANLEMRKLWQDPLCVAVSPEHKLVSAEELQPADLASFPAVLPEERTFTYRLIHAALAFHNVAPKIRLTTNYLETLKMLAAVGLGWTVLPRTMVDPTICALHFPTLILKRTLGVVWHRRRTRSAAAQSLLDSLPSGGRITWPPLITPAGQSVSPVKPS